MKILDFGLAKALELPETEGDLTRSPTLTAAATGRGEILGTAAYMSPEQATGQPIDKRADIWAFGCCLYETLTGRRAFGGTDATSTLAAVLRDEVDLDELPETTPGQMHQLLRRCLVRDSRDRLRDIGDARLELSDLQGAPRSASGGGAGPRPGRRAVWPAVIATLAVAVLAGWLLGRSESTSNLPAGGPIRFSVSTEDVDLQVPVLAPLRGRLAISPDGTKIAFVVATDGDTTLVLHDNRTGASNPLRGAEGGSHPFFSTDGRLVGFRKGNVFYSVPVEGGLAERLAQIPTEGGPLFGPAAWGENHLYFGQAGGTLSRVAPGGSVEVLATGQQGVPKGYPAVLPSGDALLYTEQERIRAFDTSTGKIVDLGLDGSGAQFVEPGYLLFVASGGLWAATFDPARLEVEGRPRLLQELDSVTQDTLVPFAASPSGTIVALQSAPSRSLVELSNDGSVTSLGVSGYLRQPRWSPDGRWIAFNRGGVGTRRVHLYDYTRASEHPLARELGLYPVWTKDGQIVRFEPVGQSGRMRIVAGPPDRSRRDVTLFESELPSIPLSVSRDGVLLFWKQEDRSLWILTLDDPSDASPWLEASGFVPNADFHPSGRWVAFEAREDEVRRIVVRPFPRHGGSQIVSVGRGRSPVWSHDGRTLHYMSDQGIVRMRVETDGDSLEVGSPELVREWEEPPDEVRSYDPHPEGRGFIAIQRVENGSPRLDVTMNAASLLREIFEGSARPAHVCDEGVDFRRPISPADGRDVGGSPTSTTIVARSSRGGIMQSASTIRPRRTSSGRRGARLLERRRTASCSVRGPL